MVSQPKYPLLIAIMTPYELIHIVFQINHHYFIYELIEPMHPAHTNQLVLRLYQLHCMSSSPFYKLTLFFLIFQVFMFQKYLITDLKGIPMPRFIQIVKLVEFILLEPKLNTIPTSKHNNSIPNTIINHLMISSWFWNQSWIIAHDDCLIHIEISILILDFLLLYIQ